MAITWKIITDFLEDSSDLVYFLPLLFLIWANLHSGFCAGLFILFVILGLETIKRLNITQRFLFFKSLNIKQQPYSKIVLLFFISVVSFCATLANPYGITIYQEVFRTVGDNFLKFHIAEWLPLIYTQSPFLIFLYIGIFVGLLAVFYKKIELNYVILSVVFLLMSFSSQRYILIFIPLTIPIFSELISQIRQMLKFSKRNDIILSAILITVSLVVFSGVLAKSVFAVKTSSSLSDYYPKKAIPFLEQLPSSENIFNEYGWGGYLIWNLPGRRFFIDGRMPSWRQDGQFAFGDYVKVMGVDKGFEDILKKYDVKVMLLRSVDEAKIEKDNETKRKADNSKLGWLFKKFPWLYSIIGISDQKDLYAASIKDGWKNIYQDNTAVILLRDND